MLGCGCSKRIKQSDNFINQYHIKVLKKNYDNIYDNFLGSDITSKSSKAEIVDFFSSVYGEAKIYDIKSSFGFNFKVENGAATSSKNYVIKGKAFDINEAITVKSYGKSWKVSALTLRPKGQRAPNKNKQHHEV